jgi:hypothetical protein
LDTMLTSTGMLPILFLAFSSNSLFKPYPP